MQRLLSSLFGFAAVFFLIAGVAEAQTGKEIYEIRSYHESSKCMEIKGAGHGNGDLGQIYGCHGGTNQRWKLRPNGSGRFEIWAVHSGKCLDVQGAHNNNGRNVQQFTCHGGNNQQWEKVEAGGTSKFIVQHSNKCLEASQGDEGWFNREDILEQRDCDNDDWERWLLTQVALCENNVCESAQGEDTSNCPEDCGSQGGGGVPPSTCPNSICEPGESCEFCSDCGSCPPTLCDPLDCAASCGGIGECVGFTCECGGLEGPHQW